MSATRRAIVFFLAGLMGVGCNSLAQVPVGGACDLPSGKFVRGYVTSDGEEHVEDGYLRRDEAGVVRFSPVEPSAVHVFQPGEVKGALVSRASGGGGGGGDEGRSRGVGPVIVDVLEVMGIVVLYTGLVVLDVWLECELYHHHH